MFVISERKGVVIEMSYDEALWLKGCMQNPLWGESPMQEEAVHQKKRHELFNALRNQIGNG